MTPFTLLLCFMTLWQFGQAAENALFYDWKEKKLVEIGKFDDTAKCKSCISACPAASNSIEEQQVNKDESVTQNSIFMRDVYSSPTTAGEMKIEICETLFSPSLVWKTAGLTFNVGYEMCYEKERIDLECSWCDNYVKVVDGKPSLKSNNGLKEAKEREKELAFYFITVLYFDIQKDGNSRVVHYVEDAINDYQHKIRTISYCQNYFSEDNSEIIGKKSEKFDDQVQILEKNPEEGTSKQSTNTSNRLVKTQIIPMRMFHTMASRLATCMYLNFAFVWENIANSTLKKIDLYLYALYRSFPDKIILFFGVDGDLQKKQAIDATAREQIASEHHLFNKFPVPEMIFRFVRVDVRVNVQRQHYGVVIVIHNNVKSVEDRDRICSVEDEIESWDGIRNTNVESGLSYVCAQTPDIFKKLGYDESIAPEITTPRLPLSLSNFPFRPNKGRSIDYRSVLDEIDHTLDYIKQMHIEY